MHEKQQALHLKAISAADHYLKCEADLISILQELDREKTYLFFEQTSLLAYARKYLKLSEPVALTLIGIARKSVQIPELKAAIQEKKMTTTNARRIVPILNLENKNLWIEKAASLSQQKLEQELAKHFPERAAPTKIRFKSETNGRLETDLPVQVLDLIKRAQEILSQKKQAPVDVAGALGAVLEEFVERHDPVKRAERAVVRREKTGGQIASKQPIAPHVSSNSKVGYSGKGRTPFSANLKHTANLRDQAQCTHIDRDGIRCENRKWLDLHHVKPISH